MTLEAQPGLSAASYPSDTKLILMLVHIASVYPQLGGDVGWREKFGPSLLIGALEPVSHCLEPLKPLVQLG
jgi:hypothetical protein